MHNALIGSLILLAATGTALAGAEIHAAIDTGPAAAGAHAIDLVVNEDGTYSLLVDGAPLPLPTMPALPSPPDLPVPLPSAPELPSAPDVPSPPSVPELPPIPTLP